MKKVFLTLTILLFGNLLAQEEDTLTLDYYEITPKDSFRHNKRFDFENPFSTRYLASPSAFTLKRGHGYYQNTYVVFNSFNVGITDNISIGGGLELVSLVGFLMEQYEYPTFFITPKIGAEVTKNLHVGGGILYANSVFFGTNLGVAFVNGTFGNTDYNITGGIGYGAIDGKSSKKPIISVSTMLRLSNHVSFVSDNWIIPVKYTNIDNTEYYRKYPIFSYGLRFFGKHMAVDLAFINNSDLSENVIYIGVPYVRCTIKF